ncbi:hypothetical protein FGRA07_11720 [Fusarium graminearum]|nr:hypothetical protein FGRA07_11720 [Fusarium graminearum]
MQDHHVAVQNRIDAVAARAHIRNVRNHFHRRAQEIHGKRHTQLNEFDFPDFLFIVEYASQRQIRQLTPSVVKDARIKSTFSYFETWQKYCTVLKGDEVVLAAYEGAIYLAAEALKAKAKTEDEAEAKAKYWLQRHQESLTELRSVFSSTVDVETVVDSSSDKKRPAKKRKLEATEDENTSIQSHGVDATEDENTSIQSHGVDATEDENTSIQSHGVDATEDENTSIQSHGVDATEDENTPIQSHGVDATEDENTSIQSHGVDATEDENTPIQSHGVDATEDENTPIQSHGVDATEDENTPIQSHGVDATEDENTPIQSHGVDATEDENMPTQSMEGDASYDSLHHFDPPPGQFCPMYLARWDKLDAVLGTSLMNGVSESEARKREARNNEYSCKFTQTICLFWPYDSGDFILDIIVSNEHAAWVEAARGSPRGVLEGVLKNMMGNFLFKAMNTSNRVQHGALVDGVTVHDYQGDAIVRVVLGYQCGWEASGMFPES